MIPDIDRVTAPQYLEDLSSAPLAELRTRRGECSHLENVASYVRRFAQSRLDLIAELRSGASAEGASGQSNASGEPQVARPPQGFVPDELSDAMIAQLDTIVSPDLAGVAELGADEVASLLDQLGAFEQTISGERRSLHTVIDALQAEVVRRYRDGEASVDELLAP